eukprot:3955950-Alexandrium_andersonii.AAC.1
MKGAGEMQAGGAQEAAGGREGYAAEHPSHRSQIPMPPGRSRQGSQQRTLRRRKQQAPCEEFKDVLLAMHRGVMDTCNSEGCGSGFVAFGGRRIWYLQVNLPP